MPEQPRGPLSLADLMRAQSQGLLGSLAALGGTMPQQSPLGLLAQFQPMTPTVGPTESVPLPRPRQETLLGQARQEYPILNNHDIGFKYSPNRGRGFLEFWPPGEAGAPNLPRPQEFDLGKVGVEVYNPKTRPIDVLGDVVSHHLINVDPKIKGAYRDFGASLQPWQHERLREQYKHAQQHDGENRSFEDWKNASGLPSYFRGYPFRQWDRAEEMYTPQQLESLDSMMNYLRGR